MKSRIFQDCLIERKAKAHLTDECRVLSQFTDKLKEEAAAQKWLPRWPDSHLTPIGCERSWEQGALFTFCLFHPHFYLLCLIPATTSALILKRAKHSFKCKYQIVLFLWGCTEWSWRLGLMFYHRGGFSLEQLQHQQPSRALGTFWSHLTTGKIKHKGWHAARQRPCLSIPPWWTHGCELQSHHSHLSSSCYWVASDVFIQGKPRLYPFSEPMLFFFG